MCITSDGPSVPMKWQPASQRWRMIAFGNPCRPGWTTITGYVKGGPACVNREGTPFKLFSVQPWLLLPPCFGCLHGQPPSCWTPASSLRRPPSRVTLLLAPSSLLPQGTWCGEAAAALFFFFFWSTHRVYYLGPIVGHRHNHGVQKLASIAAQYLQKHPHPTLSGARRGVVSPC